MEFLFKKNIHFNATKIWHLSAEKFDRVYGLYIFFDKAFYLFGTRYNYCSKLGLSSTINDNQYDSKKSLGYFLLLNVKSFTMSIKPRVESLSSVQEY